MPFMLETTSRSRNKEWRSIGKRKNINKMPNLREREREREGEASKLQAICFEFQIPNYSQLLKSGPKLEF